MRKRRLLATIAVLGVVGLAAGAVPAFTADSGTVSVSITAQAPPPGACLTLDPTLLDYETLAFSRPLAPSEADRTITATNCNHTQSQFVTVKANDATGPSGVWTLSGALAPARQCDLGPDKYALFVEPGRTGSPAGGDVPVSYGPNVLSDGAGQPAAFGPDSSEPLKIVLDMPCEGSHGAGETKTLSVTFMAVQA